jgi:16S rRNA (guanine966-N2)-methyltransferase
VRIVAGQWRGRPLVAPDGTATRPTSDRARQALFDMLMHAPWAGRAVVEDAVVLDAFAGTGALGLEALSRGAARAIFFENAVPALAALQANITRCGAAALCRVLRADATKPPPAEVAATLAFFDPPYASGLVTPAVTALRARGWLATDALLVVETPREAEPPALGEMLVDRTIGVARITVWRT